MRCDLMYTREIRTPCNQYNITASSYKEVAMLEERMKEVWVENVNRIACALICIYAVLQLL
jgi:hypothetical protein